MDGIKSTAQDPDTHADHHRHHHYPDDIAATARDIRGRTSRLLRSLGARLLLRLGLTPNQVTVAGTIGLIVAAVGFAARGRFLEATIIGTPSAYLDLADGEMARRAGFETRFGAVLDGACDRIADGVLFGSVAYWLFTTGQRWAGAGALVCLVTSSTVSFAGAKVEAVGLVGESGLAHRFTRLKLAGIGGVLGTLGVPHGVATVLWLIAALSAWTVYQRLRSAYLQAERGLRVEGHRWKVK